MKFITNYHQLSTQLVNYLLILLFIFFFFFFRLLLLLLLLLPGAELPSTADSFGLLNDLLLQFFSILDASCPIFDLHLANVLFDVILPSVLGSSL